MAAAWTTGLLFAATSLILAWLFRACLRTPHSHGFYRFFAIEAILALALLNGRYWFADRFAPHQLASWLLLFTALYLLLHGSWLLARHGQPDASRHDPTLLAFEKTRRLVTHSLFAHIRHPLYASLALFGWGLCLKQPGWGSAVLAALASALLVATALAEERENLAYFGEAYRDYQARSHRFIPGIF